MLLLVCYFYALINISQGTDVRKYFVGSTHSSNNSFSLTARPCSISIIGSQVAPSPPCRQHLSLLPHLYNHRRIARLANITIDLFGRCGNGFPRECRLVITLTQEMRIDKRREQSILEGDRPKSDADEDYQFSVCNNLHRRIVVGCGRRRLLPKVDKNDISNLLPKSATSWKSDVVEAVLLRSPAGQEEEIGASRSSA